MKILEAEVKGEFVDARFCDNNFLEVLVICLCLLFLNYNCFVTFYVICITVTVSI